MSGVTETIIFAVLGGLIPAIVWLWFWLREDDDHPEPAKYIILAFIFGMLGVPIALVLQLLINQSVLDGQDIDLVFKSTPLLGIFTIVLWASIEEFLKYKSAYYSALRKKINDEPVDVLIYLITAALGFSALENTLFLLNPLLEGDTTTAFMTSNMRFIGATLVHVASSSIIGIFAALSYFFKQEIKKAYLWTGFILSVVLHSLFNLFIISYQESIILTFTVIWIVIIVIIFLFEKIKKIHLNKINP